MGPGRDELPPADGVRLADLEPAVRAKLGGLLTAYLSMLDPALRTPYDLAVRARGPPRMEVRA